MISYNPDEWVACPRCNGPSFDVATPMKPELLECGACLHRWVAGELQHAKARAITIERDLADEEHDWDLVIERWKAKIAEEREKAERLKAGRW